MTDSKVVDTMGEALQRFVEGTEACLDLARGPLLMAGPLIGCVPPRADGVASSAVAALPAIDAELELDAYLGASRPGGSLPEGVRSGLVPVHSAHSDDNTDPTASAYPTYFFAAAPTRRPSIDVEATYGAGVDPNAIRSFPSSPGLHGRDACPRLLGDVADSPAAASEEDDAQWPGGPGRSWSRR